MADHAALVILIMGLVTLATRLLPVLIFDRWERVPDYILYLGKVVPFTAMGLLIVYCLKDVSVMESALWRHNRHPEPESRSRCRDCYLDHLLRLDEPDVKNLIVNLISYAIIRDEYRQLVKAEWEREQYR